MENRFGLGEETIIYNNYSFNFLVRHCMQTADCAILEQHSKISCDQRYCFCAALINIPTQSEPLRLISFLWKAQL